MASFETCSQDRWQRCPTCPINFVDALYRHDALELTARTFADEELSNLSSADEVRDLVDSAIASSDGKREWYRPLAAIAAAAVFEKVADRCRPINQVLQGE